jgi:hypothetical protein
VEASATTRELEPTRYHTNGITEFEPVTALRAARLVAPDNRSHVHRGYTGPARRSYATDLRIFSNCATTTASTC